MSKTCKRCGNYLLGAEERGDTCNECLGKGYGQQHDDTSPEYDAQLADELATEPTLHQRQQAHRVCQQCNGWGFHAGGLCTCQAAHDLCDAQVLAEATWDNGPDTDLGQDGAERCTTCGGRVTSYGCDCPCTRCNGAGYVVLPGAWGQTVACTCEDGRYWHLEATDRRQEQAERT
jgi:hypothetical protein